MPKLENLCKGRLTTSSRTLVLGSPLNCDLLGFDHAVVGRVMFQQSFPDRRAPQQHLVTFNGQRDRQSFLKTSIFFSLRSRGMWGDPLTNDAEALPSPGDAHVNLVGVPNETHVFWKPWPIWVFLDLGTRAGTYGGKDDIAPFTSYRRRSRYVIRWVENSEIIFPGK